jgi:hypothetical protein
MFLLEILPLYCRLFNMPHNLLKPATQYRQFAKTGVIGATKCHNSFTTALLAPRTPQPSHQTPTPASSYDLKGKTTGKQITCHSSGSFFWLLEPVFVAVWCAKFMERKNRRQNFYSDLLACALLIMER